MYMGRAGEIELYKHCLTRRLSQHQCGRPAVYRYSTERMLRSPKVCSRPCTQPRPLGKEQPPWQRALTGHFCSGTLARIPRSEYTGGTLAVNFSLATTTGEGHQGTGPYRTSGTNLVAYGGRGDRARLCEQGHATLHPGQDPDALLG